MEHLVSAESIIMQDLGPNSTDQSSSKNSPPKGDNEPANEKRILQARLRYIRSLLEIENYARREADFGIRNEKSGGQDKIH
ncbi:hypothetical protein TNCV_2721011 [Trichonephila clavipes]|nr:hypothetical protein TNCV_2721011 [Trichonephila clavipes]